MQNIESARHALTNVDIGEHVTAIGDLGARRQRIAEAIEEGRERISALAIEIRDAQALVAVDRVAAGDALLAGEVPAGVDIDALMAAQEAVKAGMNDLRRRDDDLAETLRHEQSAAIGVLAGAVEPLVAEVVDMARDAAQAVAQAYAAARAIELATSHGEAGRLASQLEPALHKLIAAGHLPRSAIAVPDEIRQALSAAEQSIRALRLSIPDQVRTFVIT